MNDLICRSAMLTAREKAIWVYENANIINADAIRERLKPLLDAIVDAPAVDAVEVVRCKDCYYFRMYHCKHPQWEYPQGFPMVTETDYCCYGERRNGDG